MMRDFLENPHPWMSHGLVDRWMVDLAILSAIGFRRPGAWRDTDVQLEPAPVRQHAVTRPCSRIHLSKRQDR